MQARVRILLTCSTELTDFTKSIEELLTNKAVSILCCAVIVIQYIVCLFVLFNLTLRE